MNLPLTHCGLSWAFHYIAIGFHCSQWGGNTTCKWSHTGHHRWWWCGGVWCAGVVVCRAPAGRQCEKIIPITVIPISSSLGPHNPSGLSLSSLSTHWSLLGWGHWSSLSLAVCPHTLIDYLFFFFFFFYILVITDTTNNTPMCVAKLGHTQ